MRCSNCLKEFRDESQLELHHIIPKSIGGTDKDGRIYLCGKCHNIITYVVIIKTMWDYVSCKDDCKDAIKDKTKRWCEN